MNNIQIFLLLISCLFLFGCDFSDKSTLASKSDPLNIFSSCNKVAIGSEHALVINENDELFAWGENVDGQLGDTNALLKIQPTKINRIVNAKCVAVGKSISVAIKHDGTVWQWGRDFDPEHKLQFQKAPIISDPKQIVGIFDAIGVTAGDGFVLVLSQSGKIYSWGVNDAGQLGQDFKSTYGKPNLVKSEVKFKFIEADISSSYAIDEYGSLWVWGSNTWQVLGIKSSKDQHIELPIRNNNIDNLVKVSASNMYVTGLNVNGQVFSWGLNLDGGLGVGESNNQSLLPTKLPFHEPVIDISSRTLLSENKEIWRWGYRYFTWGDIRWTWLWSKSEPTRLFQKTAAKNIFVSDVGLLVNGENCLESWGFSEHGLRGDGTTIKQKYFFGMNRILLKSNENIPMCLIKGDER